MGSKFIGVLLDGVNKKKEIRVSEWGAQMEVLEGGQLLTMERIGYNHKRGWLDMS